MSETPRFRLYRLLAEFRAHVIDTRTFCGEFETTYNLELEDGVLSPTENQAFAELFDRVVWYSPFPEERAKIPHDLGETEISAAVEQAVKRLGLDAAR